MCSLSVLEIYIIYLEENLPLSGPTKLKPVCHHPRVKCSYFGEIFYKCEIRFLSRGCCLVSVR